MYFSWGHVVWFPPNSFSTYWNILFFSIVSGKLHSFISISITNFQQNIKLPLGQVSFYPSLFHPKCVLTYHRFLSQKCICRWLLCLSANLGYRRTRTVPTSRHFILSWGICMLLSLSSSSPMFYNSLIVDCFTFFFKVYDVTKPTSLENLRSWQEDFLYTISEEQSANFPFIVIGNKVDLPQEEHQVSFSQFIISIFDVFSSYHRFLLKQEWDLLHHWGTTAHFLKLLQKLAKI